MYDRHETGGRPALVRLMLPYGIADRFPDCDEVCKGVSPSRQLLEKVAFCALPSMCDGESKSY